MSHVTHDTVHTIIYNVNDFQPNQVIRVRDQLLNNFE